LNPGHIYNYELKLRIKERKYHEDGKLKRYKKEAAKVEQNYCLKYRLFFSRFAHFILTRISISFWDR